jgi:hypothetical protein
MALTVSILRCLVGGLCEQNGWNYCDGLNVAGLRAQPNVEKDAISGLNYTRLGICQCARPTLDVIVRKPDVELFVRGGGIVGRMSRMSRMSSH